MAKTRKGETRRTPDKPLRRPSPPAAPARPESVRPEPGRPESGRTALGRGLSALLPAAPPSGRGLLSVPLDQLRPEKEQPRRRFEKHALDELAASVAARGVLQPILVRREAAGGYRIVAGERRWRAARQAGLAEVPVIVKEISDTEAFEIALIENIQREDLSPLEEAEAYQRLLSEHGLTQEDLARRVGKDRSTITNALRLLRLPDQVKGDLQMGDLSVGHAKVLLGLEDPAEIVRVAGQVAARGLSVRETEKLVQRMRAPGTGRPRPAVPADLHALSARLEQATGLQCEIRLRAGAPGEVAFPCGGEEGARRILEKLLALAEGSAADGAA